MAEHFVYLMSGDGWSKIGVASDPRHRCRQHSSRMAEQVRCDVLFSFEDRAAAEAMEQMTLALAFRVQHFGEWFIAEPTKLAPLVRAASAHFSEFCHEVQAGFSERAGGAGMDPMNLIRKHVAEARS